MNKFFEENFSTKAFLRLNEVTLHNNTCVKEAVNAFTMPKTINMKIFRNTIISLFLASSMTASAGEYIIKQYRLSGPYSVCQPFMLDSVDVKGHPFSFDALLTMPLNGSPSVTVQNGNSLRSNSDYGIAQLSFDVNVSVYTKVTLSVSGLSIKKCFLDDKECDCQNVALTPGSHTFTITTLLQKGKTVKPRLSLSYDSGYKGEQILSIPDPGTKRLYNIKDVLNGRRYSSIELSASGRYALVNYYDTHTGGSVVRSSEVRDLSNNTIIRRSSNTLKFYPNSDDLIFSRTNDEGKKQLVKMSISDGQETLLADNLPDDTWNITPDGKHLIVSHINEGPKEDKDIYQIVEPDDRQPGWRDRITLSLYNIADGTYQPLTYGYHNVSLLDISRDSRYILFMTSRSRLTSRPTTLFSLWRMDLQTMQAECLVKDDGFLSSAKFSPDGKQLAIVGSPECLGGIGKNVPEGRIPSMYDYQLYTFDIATKRIKAVTKYFNPGINDFAWSAKDNNIWFTALDKDYCHLYFYNPATDTISQIKEPEDLVTNFSLADNAYRMLWFGESASNSDRLYTLDTTTGKSTLVEDLSAKLLKDVELGPCNAWSFVNSRGDTISCRYYLPPYFDKTKQYPMIVNYYGGCSPTSRNFESRYPQHVYAAAGYIVLVVNPSGAVGWGQEFSSRHVNTAGKGVAEDIIDATRLFCQQHTWVDSLHVGCIGASYGGFMTQYLQTQTNIFAAAISHAGISDHTSYWGEGYWGYSYSEVSMAGSYPWTRKDLYVDQSPLFNAEKIHTPLLFLHGNSDHNVPIGESIQMFTALKLLGRPTAFVVVDGQDHHITDYNKRIKWHNTIMAWFQRYLKGDASWWNSLYDKMKDK